MSKQWGEILFHMKSYPYFAGALIVQLKFKIKIYYTFFHTIKNQEKKTKLHYSFFKKSLVLYFYILLDESHGNKIARRNTGAKEWKRSMASEVSCAAYLYRLVITTRSCKSILSARKDLTKIWGRISPTKFLIFWLGLELYMVEKWPLKMAKFHIFHNFMIFGNLSICFANISVMKFDKSKIWDVHFLNFYMMIVMR